MSTKSTATEPSKPEPTGAPLIRIRHVRFVSKGVIIASPKEAEDALSARDSDKIPAGYDIWLVPDRRAFRFERWDGGKHRVTKWVPECRVDNYEEWVDADRDHPSSAV